MARYQYILDRLNEIGYNDDPFVVDCACGYGKGTKILSEIKGCTVKGFDISPKIISKYASFQDIDVACADITSLPLNDKSVDIFVCSETLEHLTEKESIKAVSEICRVCKSDAEICITVPFDKRSLKTGSHKQFISEKKIKKMFNGYDVLHCSYYNLKKRKKTKGVKGNLVIIFRKNT
jgi:ubiquinone/menaquinone biosynthesis C-methylase UbiE